MKITKSQKGTIALQNAFVKKYGVGTFGIYCYRKVRGGTKMSVHAEGRAWDCKVYADKDLDKGNAIYKKLQDKHLELGIEKVIWNRKVWTPADGESDYTGLNPHIDHLHIEQSVEKATTNPLTEREIARIIR